MSRVQVPLEHLVLGAADKANDCVRLDARPHGDCGFAARRLWRYGFAAKAGQRGMHVLHESGDVPDRHVVIRNMRRHDIGNEINEGFWLFGHLASFSLIKLLSQVYCEKEMRVLRQAARLSHTLPSRTTMGAPAW
jgi:hypothetical protein